MRSLLAALLALALSCESANAHDGPCAVVFDNQDNMARTQELFEGVTTAGLTALRWHVRGGPNTNSGTRAAPSVTQVEAEVYSDLVHALAPTLVVAHYSAFYYRTQANVDKDNVRLLDFMLRLERLGTHPRYVIFTRSPASEADIETYLLEAAGELQADLAERIEIVKIRDLNQSRKIVSKIVDRIKTMGFPAACPAAAK